MAFPQLYPQKAPRPGIRWVFTEGHNLRKDPLGTLLRCTLKFGHVVRYRGFWTTIQITHPEHILQVLQTNAANYHKGRAYRILKLSLGEGLLTSDGTLWQRQRKITQPAFHSRQLAAFVRIMRDHTLAMLQQWETMAEHGRSFDIVPELMRLTLNIVSHALFTTSLESDVDVIRQTQIVGREFSVKRAFSVVQTPQWLPIPRNREYRHSLARFHAVIDRMIEQRHKQPLHANDLLQMLMEAFDENDTPMPATQLRDEVATLLTAGHETTTLVLAWTIFLISTRPEVMERMRAEIGGLNGGIPEYADLWRLRYTRMVVDETMRLYPPVWLISRTAVTDDVIGGYEIPAGAELLMLPYVTHRHPDWWVYPDKFWPEHFLPENCLGRPRGAYLPFGAGPRVCIGSSFAMTEILFVLVLLLQRFHPELVVDPAQVKVEASVTLRPSPGVPVRLERV